MSATTPAHRAPLSDELSRLASSGGKPFVTLLEHGTLSVELYAPKEADRRQPHTRDEVCVAVRGSGMFVNGEPRHPFEPGDLRFVPAGVVHRFENFSDDLPAWVMFYGPEGGERT